MQYHCECSVQRRQLVSGSCHRLHHVPRGHIFSCRLHFFKCVCRLRCGSIRFIGRLVHGVCVWLLLRIECTKLHGMHFGKLLQQLVECSVRRRQLVCGSCHRLHELLRGNILSCRIHCFYGLLGLRCGSIRSVGRRVHGVCFWPLLRIG